MDLILFFISVFFPVEMVKQEISVYDGDTITVDGAKIRIIGIECPEIRRGKKCRAEALKANTTCDEQKRLGFLAKKAAKDLILNNGPVKLECEYEVCKVGYFGRALRYIRLSDGRDFGLEMIRSGHCRDCSKKYPHPREKNYKEVQNGTRN